MKTSKSDSSTNKLFHRSLAWVIVALSATFGVAQAAPTINGVYSYDGLTVGVEFSVPVDSTSAQVAGNYGVTGTTVASAALLADGQSVALTLSSPSQITGQFVVTVNNVEDLSLNPIAAGSKATNTVLNLTTLPFGDADPAYGGQPYSATYTGNYASLIAGGSDLWGAGDNFVFEYLTVTNDFDYRARVVSLSNDGEVWDRSGVMVRDSLTDMFSHMILVAKNAGPNAGNSSADSVQVTLRYTFDTTDATFSQPANPLPAFYGSNSWVRLQRSGTIYTSYYSSNGVNWVSLYQFDGAVAGDGAFTNSVLYLGLATCSHNPYVDTTNVVSDFGVTPHEPVQIFTQPPATALWRQNSSQSLTVVASGVPAFYQWRTNGVPIPGATNATFSVAAVQPFNAGTYSVQVYNDVNSVLSSNCVVTYTADTNRPTINGVFSYNGLTVGVEYNKLMDSTSAQVAGNYGVSGTTVASATLLADGQSVALTLSSPSQITGQFVVTVNNVKDLAGNTIASNSKATNTVLNLTMLAYGDAAGQSYSATYSGNYATLVAGGSDLWNAGDNFVFEYLMATNDFDYRARVVSLSNDGQAFNRSGLMVRDTDATDIYGHEIFVARNAGPNAGNSSADSAQVTLRFTKDDQVDATFSQPPNPLPAFYGSNSWVRLQRSGTIFTSYYSSNGVNWVQLYQFDGAVAGDGMFTNGVLYLGLASGAHSASVTSTDVISDFGVTPLPPIPSITTPPTSDVLYSGHVATFTAQASGAPPLSYQWQLNGTNLIGATSSTLTASNAGPYRLIVTGSSGFSVTSSVVTLTVIVPTYQYEKAVLADNPVAYWRLNETNNPANGTAPSYDYVGGFNGTYGVGSGNAFDGVVGLQPAGGFYGFETNNTALETTNSTANSYITGGMLNLNTNTVTMTAWIKPTGTQNGAAGVIFCRGGTTSGSGLSYINSTTLGYNWNGNYWWVNTGLTPPSDVWSFVAVVTTPTNATVYVCNTNGLSSYTDSETGIINEAFDGPIIIGSDAYDYTGRAFNGAIDEVAVFKYSLTQPQIQQLYFAGVASPLFISKPGSNLNLNWTYGTLLESTNITGPWTTNAATSPYTVTPTGPQKFYRLQLQ